MQSPALQPHFAGGDAGEQRAVEANERLSCRIVEVDGVARRRWIKTFALQIAFSCA